MNTLTFTQIIILKFIFVKFVKLVTLISYRKVKKQLKKKNPTDTVKPL